MNTIRVLRRSFLGIGKVRIIQTRPDGPPYIPIFDLARAIGYPEKTVCGPIRRNPEDFHGDVFSVPIGPGGQGESGEISLEPPFRFGAGHGTWRPTRLACLNYEGLVGLLFMLDPLRIKDKRKRGRIYSFRRWAIHVTAAEGRMP